MKYLGDIYLAQGHTYLKWYICAFCGTRKNTPHLEDKTCIICGVNHYDLENQWCVKLEHDAEAYYMRGCTREEIGKIDDD